MPTTEPAPPAANPTATTTWVDLTKENGFGDVHWTNTKWPWSPYWRVRRIGVTSDGYVELLRAGWIPRRLVRIQRWRRDVFLRDARVPVKCTWIVEALPDEHELCQLFANIRGQDISHDEFASWVQGAVSGI